MHPELTVFENLYYNAMTRLPADMPAATKKAHVQHVIKVHPPYIARVAPLLDGIPPPAPPRAALVPAAPPQCHLWS